MVEFFRSVADLAGRMFGFIGAAILTWLLGVVTVYDKWIAPTLPPADRAAFDAGVNEGALVLSAVLIVVGFLRAYDGQRRLTLLEHMRADGLEAAHKPEEPIIEIDAAAGKAVIRGKHPARSVEAVTKWASDASTAAAHTEEIDPGTIQSIPTGGSPQAGPVLDAQAPQGPSSGGPQVD